MTKTERIEKYIADFLSTRMEEWEELKTLIRRKRHTNIYSLKEGPKLMDMLLSLVSVCREKLYASQLVPQNFATPEALIEFLKEFRNMLEQFQPYLTMNSDEIQLDFIVQDLQKMKNEMVQAIDYIMRMYDYEDTVIPYQELRYNLIVGNVDAFIGILKSILASVSYAIAKVREGYFHSNVYLILRLLGFDILAEEITSKGRIDATIRFSDAIYILEFKFDQSKDVSNIALQQIKDMQYAQKFDHLGKNITLVGISFSEEEKNINGYSYMNMSVN